MLLLLKGGNQAKEVQASPMRGNEGEKPTRGNRKVKVRETGRETGETSNRSGGAPVIVPSYSSGAVSPTV